MAKKDGNFTVRCVKAESPLFTKGKEYVVSKGKITSDKRPYKTSTYFNNIEKLNRTLCTQFELVVNQSETTTITIYNTPGSPKVSAVMRRGDKVIKSAKAMYNPNDALEGKPFSLDDGMELAVRRLFGWEEKAKPISLVKEVKRPAKIGEWIKVTFSRHYKEWQEGEIYQVKNRQSSTMYNGNDTVGIGKNYILFDTDYVVLENYHPETPVKFRKAKAGDRIKIVKKERHDPTVEIGDIFTVTSTGNQIAPCVRTEQHNVFYDEKEEYIILNR